MALTGELPNHAGLAVDLLAAWRHGILDGVFRSGASFRGYGNAGFESSTDLVGRNGLLTQGSLRLTLSLIHISEPTRH